MQVEEEEIVKKQKQEFEEEKTPERGMKLNNSFMGTFHK